MKAKPFTRQSENLQILEAIKQFIEEHPEQRFHQALLNLDVLRRVELNTGGSTFNHFYVDEAHTEPHTVLARIYNRLTFLEAQDESN